MTLNIVELIFHTSVGKDLISQPKEVWNYLLDSYVICRKQFEGIIQGTGSKVWTLQLPTVLAQWKSQQTACCAIYRRRLQDNPEKSQREDNCNNNRNRIECQPSPFFAGSTDVVSRKGTTIWLWSRSKTQHVRWSDRRCETHVNCYTQHVC